MKKITLLMVTLLFALIFINVSYADEVSGDVSTSKTATYTDSDKSSADIDELDNRMGNASKTTIKNLTSKEEEIAEYTEKFGGNKTNATVLYYLKKVAYYSVPVCFVGLVIAGLNFFIIGNKKLEKREAGFKMLVTLIVGLIVFQALPLLFTIIALAGR